MLPFLIAIDFQNYRAENKGLSTEVIDRLGAVFITVSLDTLEAACQFIKQMASILHVHADVTDLSDKSHILSVQDAGAARVFISFEQLNTLIDTPLVFDDRVAILITAEMRRTDRKQKGWYRDEIHSRLRYSGKGTNVGCCYVDVTENDVGVNYLGGVVLQGWDLYPEWIKVPDEWDATLVREAARYLREPILDARKCHAKLEKEAEGISIVDRLLGSVHSCQQEKELETNSGDGVQQRLRDENGALLYRTLVIDEVSSDVQVLFSTAKTVSNSLRDGQVSFCSQQTERGAAEHKKPQKLLKLGRDPDQFVLRFIVRDLE